MIYLTVVVIGATGYIGSNVYNFMKKKNVNVLGTKCNAISQEYIEFDILNDDFSSIDSMVYDSNKYAVICAGDTSIDFCFHNRERAYKKNVIATKSLIIKLRELGYKVIFFSTDNVFDGKVGRYTEDDALNPINEYGRMKAEMENYILEYEPNVCIMRLGKVIGDFTNKKDLLLEWFYLATEGKSIPCIKNNCITLTHINDILNSLYIIITCNMKGIYNIVGNESNNRKDLCREFLYTIKNEYNPKIKNRMSKFQIVVEEKDLSEFNFCDGRPLNLSMNNSRFVNEAGYNFLSMDEIFNRSAKEIIDLYV